MRALCLTLSVIGWLWALFFAGLGVLTTLSSMWVDGLSQGRTLIVLSALMALGVIVGFIFLKLAKKYKKSTQT
tara:strand:- start:372 stop:590 length:219 start_codon:yes stop_codon:yes gene_type:complete